LDVYADIFRGSNLDWRTHHEALCKCRYCHSGCVLEIRLTNHRVANEFITDNSIAAYKGAANDFFEVLRPITLRDSDGAPTPELVPEPIANVFREGASSYVAACYNAAGAMFRLALDMATKSLLPQDLDGANGGPNRQQRTRLKDRLDWLFESGILPRDLEPLAECIREDGNDGAHDGTLSDADAADLLDFATALLQRVYTEPGRIREAQERREARRRDPDAA